MVYIFLGIFIVLFCYYENNIIQVTKISLNKNVKSPVKIVHLSDIHSKEFGINNKTLINKVLSLKPDLVAVTGDLIDMSGQNIEKMISLLVLINNIAPVYYILGNHENRLYNLDKVISKIKTLGINVLIDEIKLETINDDNFYILGLNEDQGSYESYIKRKKGVYDYKNYAHLFNELEKKNGSKIVLSHYPENFSLIGDRSYNKYDFDLMLSGHAHGGQFILPFIGGLYSPSQGIFPKYYSGLYSENRDLIVSRGLGPSRFPLRLFNRPEIILLRIEKKSENI